MQKTGEILSRSKRISKTDDQFGKHRTTFLPPIFARP